jgi:hypothetical protein
MRKLLLPSTFAAILATTGLAVEPSWKREHFCSMPGARDPAKLDPIIGLNCSFRTWDQCVATARSLGRPKGWYSVFAD